jgi:hypothetical protein
MLHIPNIMAQPRQRIWWVTGLRDLAFSGGAFAFAGSQMRARPADGASWLVTLGRFVVGAAALVFGVEDILHPTTAPDFPLDLITPTWIPGHRGVRCNMKRIHASLRLLSTLLLAMLVLQGCNALNPLCGSTRPAPSISALSATTITFAQVQQGFLLTVNGSHIVSSSVVVINGTTLSTQVLSDSQLRVTLTTTLITGPGTASVTINTPSGNSGNLGCTSGGTSPALTLTIT